MRAGRRRVMLTLDALTIAPERFYADKNDIYSALRAAYWGVRSRTAPSDITQVEDLLWQTALKLEQAGCSRRPRNCASCRC